MGFCVICGSQKISNSMYCDKCFKNLDNPKAYQIIFRLIEHSKTGKPLMPEHPIIQDAQELIKNEK